MGVGGGVVCGGRVLDATRPQPVCKSSLRPAGADLFSHSRNRNVGTFSIIFHQLQLYIQPPCREIESWEELKEIYRGQFYKILYFESLM